MKAKKKILKIVVSICMAVVLLFLWNLYTRNNSIAHRFLSDPVSTAKYFIENYLPLLKDMLNTSFEIFGGSFIAIILSFIFMCVCVIYPKFLKAVQPVVVVSQIIPIIVFYPIFMVLLGIGLVSNIAMVALMCFFPMFVNFAAGVESVPENVHSLLYMYNTKKIFEIFKIIIPLSAPYIFSALKITVTMAIMGAIVAEFTSALHGLGFNLYNAKRKSMPELLMSSVLLIIMIGVVLYSLIEWIEKKKGYWYLKDNNKKS
jgi:NitT/TauT family transport system permease protein